MDFANQSNRELFEKPPGKNFHNNLGLGWWSALDRDGERKAFVSDDIRTLTRRAEPNPKSSFRSRQRGYR